ncbi:4-hydroxy-tetrahydrodipicolinate synthase [Flavobacteriaceae bacterium]|jgi:4-hydroxy-tetrahydrodipicolinate synthase|nr:4-hydroxy-tetrahydrodipicolinate synthase [Flavobacteriaceae bacterium]MBT4297832.1 4-hydroxy-tetrahydrodipicolinate synthase [Flavobacteriaceae bacterium]MBT4960615.1 4-hydroxy-tetrahydrodipicolinate synthase [Flavobacteriaceae bacterium]MBT5233070.1 4-hydroxy-tetrahydrodipicolinate synthase [Flavobacteriaceae bacterium]MBT5492950.1 4-hydroxy-tetrahydrodipicolinate synthase [Flavobacteriaceae bacterium]|tara:strand:- start:8519 stop:9415 length:897 start_codon:yes stop_codon:yes gene_type:complete
MSLLKKLKGTGVAVVTPFKKDLSIDFVAIKNLVDFLVENDINYIVVQGTTGESSTMSNDEKIISRKAFVEANNNRVPLVLGLGSNDTMSLLNEIKESDFLGYSAILSVTPYYNRPTMEGLYKHYSLIAQSSTIPIILYNVPSRTGCNILPETTIRLANEFKNIIGIKEASGDLNQVKQLIINKPDDFLVISGDDNTAYQSVLMGGDGVISVIAGCIPKEFSEIINLSMEKKEFESQSKFKIVKPLLDYLFLEGNPSGIKSALHKLNLCENILRLPLVPVSDELKIKINNSISTIIKDY